MEADEGLFHSELFFLQAADERVVRMGALVLLGDPSVETGMFLFECGRMRILHSHLLNLAVGSLFKHRVPVSVSPDRTAAYVCATIR
jgi:hypothetical protein